MVVFQRELLCLWGQFLQERIFFFGKNPYLEEFFPFQRGVLFMEVSRRLFFVKLVNKYGNTEDFQWLEH